jgi:ribosomal-protein-serine acetyltransferase
LFRLIDANRAHLAAYIPGVVEHVGTQADAEAHAARSAEGWARGEVFELLLLSCGEVCGVVRLNQWDRENGSIFLSYFVGAEHQGRGLITRAARALLDLAFDRLELNRVELRCVPENVGSVRVAERLGFVREGVLRQAERLHGRFVDNAVYGLLREEHERP